MGYIPGTVLCIDRMCHYDIRLFVYSKSLRVWFAWLSRVMKSESACMRKVELWVAALRVRQVAGRIIDGCPCMN
jgi:hypothetical protein